MKFVDQKMTRLLPDKVAIMFDVFTSGSTNYLEIVSSFLPKKNFIYQVVMLGFPLVEYETSQGATEQIYYLHFVMGV